MKDNENITIVIATHNNSKTIKRALNSVTRCIRPANQLIIGDNDSTDGTYDVLCDLLGAKPIEVDGKSGLPPKFEGKFESVPVTIFRKKLSTIAHTLNIAVQMKWEGVTIFGFIDPESWYAGDKISQAISAFQDHPAIACVISDCDNHHADGKVERVFRNSFDTQRLLANYEYDRNFLVRAQVFPKLKSGFNEQMQIREDYELMLRISEIGLIYHIPAPLHHNIVQDMDEPTKQSIAQYEQVARQLTAQRRGQSGG